MTEMEQKVDRLEGRRKRLIYRSWHRGTKEMDLLMGNFADAYVETFGDEQLTEYEAVLDINDPELYDMYLGKTLPREDQDSDVLKSFLEFVLEAA